MDDAKQQLIERLKSANNVLVTVSRDPSVDQLASCIGLGLLLNKQGKHAAAVFSGQIPSTLEFLQPEETLEKTTDSLRDFIIALDKSKADKLRYKVEDNVVRIFITPYRTSITQDDLEFSEGDFNVDVVVALGVHRQEDLDEAIVSHGRILHDATVATINTVPDEGLGSINWYDPDASSLSELVTDLAEELGPGQVDNQIATALLTGIVSETKRFSNDKTSAQTMSASAALMAAGANQQLVASKLEEKPQTLSGDQAASTDSNGTAPADAGPEDGTLQIDHSAEPPAPEEMPVEPSDTEEEPEPDSPASSPEPASSIPPSPPLDEPSNLSHGARLLTEPPSLGGTLTANSHEEGLDPVTDPLSLPDAEQPQMFDRRPTTFSPPQPLTTPPISSSGPAASPALTMPPPLSTTPAPAPIMPTTLTPPPPTWMPPASPTIDSDEHGQTLTELEQSLGDPHGKEERVDSARDEVNKALSTSTATDEPIQALNAQALGGSLHANDTSADSPPEPAQVTDPTAPPPVPPPIPFQFGSTSPPQNPPQ
jgi:hypothetical protein